MLARELHPCVLKDHRGTLKVLDPLPIVVVRAFLIMEVPPEENRGGHAHRTGSQIIACMAGSFFCDVSSPNGTARSWHMSHNRAILVPPLHWISLYGFSSDAVCSVLCDEGYQTPISDPKEFFRLTGQGDA